MELLGEILDELAEIHPAVRDIVEDGLGAVPLEFHVANFHLEPQAGGNLAGADHRLFLPGNGLLPFFDIELLGFAVNAADLGRLGIDSLALHLSHHGGPFQRDNAEVVAAGCLDDHEVARLDALPRSVGVDTFAGILETDFVVLGILLLRDALVSIVYLQLAATLAIGRTGLPVLPVGHGAAPEAVVLYIL